MPLCAVILALSPDVGCAAASATVLTATSSEPRAFGYQIGDVVARNISVHAPEGLVLDEGSLPRPGARGKALELRAIARRSHAESGGQRHELALEYQVMLSPPETRTLEMPGFTLRFDGQPRAQEVRVEAWPVTVSPLVPVDVSPRRGLGELQPDAAPPLFDTAAGRHRLVFYGGLVLLLSGYLAVVYIGLPWRRRAHRPFASAWRSIRGLKSDSPELVRRAAFRHLHEALNHTAGEVVFEHAIDRFVGAQPRYEPLRDDLVTFFQQSRREFFGDADGALADRAWLIEFSRRCRDAERGAA